MKATKTNGSELASGIKRLERTGATNKFEKKVEAVEANPTARKIENLYWVRSDIENLECETVDKQEGKKEGSPAYMKLEKVIDKCNELYERIEDLENPIDDPEPKKKAGLPKVLAEAKKERERLDQEKYCAERKKNVKEAPCYRCKYEKDCIREQEAPAPIVKERAKATKSHAITLKPCGGKPFSQPGETFSNYKTALDEIHIQYEFRTPSGSFFSCMKPTLAECRKARDEWKPYNVIREKDQDPAKDEIKVGNALQAVLIRDAMALFLAKRQYLSELEKTECREMFDQSSRAFGLDCDNIEMKRVQDQIVELIG